jgi:hypothetical protein
MNEANEFSLAIGALINIKKQRGEILTSRCINNHRHQPYCWRVALQQSPLPL